MRIAIYCRISSDVEGKELGVKRQETDCREYVEKHWPGFTSITVFTDNDISAMGMKRRPEYQRMLKGIVRGEFDVVVAWHLDRLTRSPKELEEYIEACGGESENAIPTHTLDQGDDMHLDTAEGRMFARIGAIIAHYFVEHNAKNGIRAKQQRRDSGLFYGGHPPNYGWRKIDKNHIEAVPEHAVYIRKMYRDYLAGKPIADIAKDMNDAGQDKVAGRPWTYANVRKLLRKATNAGLIEYFPKKIRNKRSEWMGGVSGEIYEGLWEGIVSVETWQAACDKMVDPTTYQHRGPKHYSLLGGIMVCETCGKPVYSKMRRGRRAYTCYVGHTSVDQEMVNEYVIETILAKIRVDSSAASIPELIKESQMIKVSRAELGVQYGKGLIDMSTMLAASKTFNDRESVIKAELSALDGVDENTGTREWWDGLTLDERRGLIESTMSITLKPLPVNGRSHLSPVQRAASRLVIRYKLFLH